jgi:lysophospholipase L1-like esterase
MLVRRGLRFWCWLWLLAVTLNAQGELVVANFSATKPMKVMLVGDSITDDCVTNGAWRAPLQPLLETNGFFFTNMGRLTSSGYTGFTKRKHEGYCGSVIGPPGVFAVYSYNTQDNYLQKIIPDALSITDNRPDLMLILIGANDIGRGRNPRVVATNDMPRLLNIIFSNLPNANVILAKPTSLQDANQGYGTYATNVPIYNAALQAMVNQRRALGQSVFLADMFSAVDYRTMFYSDHLHPSPRGLKAIANEWGTRIQAISIRTNQFTTVLVNGGAVWKYRDTGEDLGISWSQTDFDDSGWSNGIARFGYGDPATATIVSFGVDPTNKFTTTYFRRNFVLPWNFVITNLNFRLARSDGAVVWLNGQEVYRVNLPDGLPLYTNLALTAMTGFTSHVFYQMNVPVTGVPAGTNLLAVEIHPSSATNSSLGFDMELIGSGYILPTPSVSIAAAGPNILVGWPATNSTGFNLYSTTNPDPTSVWSLAGGVPQTNSGQIVVTQSLEPGSQFFRLQRP